jgi:hypothetical protein
LDERDLCTGNAEVRRGRLAGGGAAQIAIRLEDFGELPRGLGAVVVSGAAI